MVGGYAVEPSPRVPDTGGSPNYVQLVSIYRLWDTLPPHLR